MAYDHPSYLTRQYISMDVTSAGAYAVAGYCSFPSDMRLRRATATVYVAGTSAAEGNAARLIYIGTTVSGFDAPSLTTSTGTVTIGIIALGSSTANSIAASPDYNTRLVSGGVFAVKNGTDATGVCKVVAEMHLDPDGV